MAKKQSGRKSMEDERIETVKTLLAKDRIEELDRKGVVAVLDCIHAMDALKNTNTGAGLKFFEYTA